LVAEKGNEKENKNMEKLFTRLPSFRGRSFKSSPSFHHSIRREKITQEPVEATRGDGPSSS